ncbi:MFS transporter [Runella sp.]|uniref:MFS transporter n=1 Tax=Runella sp. TaxID=1960881 RepID=UPI003D128ECF
MTYENLQNRLKELIDTNPMSAYQIVIVALCFILNFNDGIDVLVVSFTGSEIAHEWGLSKSELGYIFSAGLAGMTAGCFLLAPLGDKIGRRNIFLISLVLITSGMLLAYTVTSYAQLLGLRVVTGLGIGGILPNLATVAAEFSNTKRRDFSVGLVQAGWPLGAILTGFFTTWAVPEFGWRFAYLSAGLVSLVMLIGVYIFMPESLAFLGKHQPKNAKDKINAILEKMHQAGIEQLPTKPHASQPIPLKDLFAPLYAASTIRLWTGIFFGFLTLYTLMSWVPNIAKESGMPFEMATLVGTALNFGAFTGVFVMGMCITRFGIKKVLLGFMLTAFTIMLIYGNLKLTPLLMFILTFFIGFFVQGGFNAFYPTATRIYPANMRSTGVGLAMGVGRFGAILGPALFGIFSDLGLEVTTLFSLFSIPLLVAGFMAYSIPSKNVN